jgi:hypothetical protein
LDSLSFRKVSEMQLHPKALFAFAGFGMLLMLGMDARLGLAAILAVALIDALSFLLPFGLWRDRDRA